MPIKELRFMQCIEQRLKSTVTRQSRDNSQTDRRVDFIEFNLTFICNHNVRQRRIDCCEVN